MLRPPWRVVERALRLRCLRALGHSPSFAYLAARTLFFDETVRAALDAGIERVLIIGAGYDSRAWRLRRHGVEFIEIDHPDTQADKKRRAPADGPRYEPVDLARHVIPASLLDRPAIAAVEGTTMYLSEDQVARLLGSIACPGGRLVVNFGIGGGNEPRSRRTTRATAAAGGEARLRGERDVLQPAGSGKRDRRWWRPR